MNTSYKTFLGIILGILFIGGVIFTNFSYKPTKNVVFSPSISSVDNAAFSTTSPSLYPKAFVPEANLTTQFWDDGQNTGSLFNINKSIDVVFVEYEKKLLATGWTIDTKNINQNGAYFSVRNKKSAQTARIVMSAIGDKKTSVIITISNK